MHMIEALENNGTHNTWNIEDFSPSYKSIYLM
jgi:hypothetical protein